MIGSEIVLTLQALYLGLRIGIYYDLLIIMRRLIRHKKWFKAIEDFLFAIIFGFVAFALIYTYNDGALRAYIFIWLMAGIIFGHKVIGALLVRICEVVVKTIGSVLKKIFKRDKIK